MLEPVFHVLPKKLSAHVFSITSCSSVRAVPIIHSSAWTMVTVETASNNAKLSYSILIERVADYRPVFDEILFLN